MAKIRHVKKRIRLLKRTLNTLVNELGTGSPETILCSHQLDQAINELYRAKAELKLSPVAKLLNRGTARSLH